MADQSKNIQLLNIKIETDYSTHSYPDEYDGKYLSLDNTSYVERSNDKRSWTYNLNFTVKTKNPLTEDQKSNKAFTIDENGDIVFSQNEYKTFSLQYGIYDGDSNDEICISEGIVDFTQDPEFKNNTETTKKWIWEDVTEIKQDPDTGEAIEEVICNVAHISIKISNVVSGKTDIFFNVRLNLSNLNYEFGEETIEKRDGETGTITTSTEITHVTCINVDMRSDNSSIKLDIKLVDGQTQTVTMGFNSRSAKTSSGNVYPYPSGYGRLHLEKRPGSVVKLSSSGDSWIVDVGVLITSSGKVNVVRGSTCDLTYSVYDGSNNQSKLIYGPVKVSTYFAPWNQNVGDSGSTAYANIKPFTVSGDSTSKISIYMDLDMSGIGYYSLDLRQTVTNLRGNLVIDISTIQLAPIITDFKWSRRVEGYETHIYEDELSMQFTSNRSGITDCKMIVHCLDQDNRVSSSEIQVKPSNIENKDKTYIFKVSRKNWENIVYARHYSIDLWIAVTRSGFNDLLWSKQSKNQQANTKNHKPKLSAFYTSYIDSYKVSWTSDPIHYTDTNKNIEVPVNVKSLSSDIGELYTNYTAGTYGNITYIKITPGSIALFRMAIQAKRYIINTDDIDYGDYVSDILSFSIKLLEAAHIEDFKDFIFGNSIPLKLENDTGRDFMIELLANNNLIALRPYDSEERDGYEAITLLQRELDKLYKSFKHTSNEVIILARVKTVGDYGTYYKYASAKCVVKGNVKTTWIGDDRRVPKRSKDFIGIDDNEIVKRCIAWIGDENEIPRRCI